MSRIEPKGFALKDGRKGIIRSADKSDAESLLKLMNTIITEEAYNVTTLNDLEKIDVTVEKEQKRIENHYRNGNIALVADVDGNIAGTVSIENGNRPRISHVVNLHISVQKEYRTNGVGTALLKTVLEWAKNDPVVEKVALGVFENNTTAIKLYEKFGFIEEGRRVKEIKISPDKYIDSILMYKFVK